MPTQRTPSPKLTPHPPSSVGKVELAPPPFSPGVAHSCVPATTPPTPDPRRHCHSQNYRQVITAILIGLALSSISISAIASTEPAPASTKKTTPSSKAWSSADTKIANHYLQILQSSPEYGKVFNLLWDLYRSHQQQDLLFDYLAQVAAQPDAAVAKILYAHLLRKDQQLEQAKQYYLQALKIDPNNFYALRGTAEIFDQQENTQLALSYYDQLLKLLPSQHKDALALILRRADLLKSEQRIDEAVEVWNLLLKQYPQDKKLRTRLIAQLLEVGRTEQAIRILIEQSQSSDPQEKLSALETLSGLYGFIDDFDRATEATQKAMRLLHYKDYRYDRFFAKQVRLYERFERLAELEKILLDQNTRQSNSEHSLRDLADFFRLTAKPKQEEIWVQALTLNQPDDPIYALRLAELLIENEKFLAAQKQLDLLLKSQNPPPLKLIFMRALTALHSHGKDAAQNVLKNYLATVQKNQAPPPPETLTRLIQFAQQHYLDQLVEDLLLQNTSEKNTPSEQDLQTGRLALARFFHQRGRSQKAKETIHAYLAQNAASDKYQPQRLLEAAKLYAELKFFGDAQQVLLQALEVSPDEKIRKETLLLLASVQHEAKETDLALASYQQLWDQATTLSEQSEIDQHLFSLLRALVKAPLPNTSPAISPLLMGPPQTLAEHRRLAIAASRSASHLNLQEPLPKKLLNFYEKIKQQAQQHPDLSHKYRVAWWGFKLQDYREMYQQLSDLHDKKNPNIEVENLMLELAELTGNTLLSGKKLKLLAEIDPENRSEYLRRWAEFRFKMEYQDQAVELMEKLAQQDDASLSTLKSLVDFYKAQGRDEDQLAVWRNAYDKASIDQKRQIAKQLTSTLLGMGKDAQALEVQLDLIQSERDPFRQRRLFESQLTLASRSKKLDWLKKRYSALISQSPFDPFYPEALGKIYQASGDSDGAYQLLKKAYYMSDQNQQLLAQLGELANQSNDLKAAIYYRRQLILSDSSQDNLESWRLLISMLEKDLRVAEADLTRLRLEGKFSRDAEFLQQSADYYLQTHRPQKAQQIYLKLVKLRPWDAALWLELGLLQNDNGETSAALTSFLQSLANSRQDALPKQTAQPARSYYPIIPGRTQASGSGTQKNKTLEKLAKGLQEYRFLEEQQQDNLSAWLRKDHPEFQRSPTERFAVRLRAIEEAATLSRQNPAQLKKWLAEWVAPTTLAAEERLWAAFYAGSYPQAQNILDQNTPPHQSDSQRFCYALMSLRMNHLEAMLQQEKTNDDSSSFAVLCAFLLMQDNPRLLTQNQLESLFSKTPVTISIARHLQNNLQLDGKIEAAFKVAQALINTQPNLDADFLYKTAQSAEWLGLPLQRLYWLQRSHQRIEPNLIRGLPVSFYGITSELYALQESAQDKTAVLEVLRDRITQHPASSPEAILEAKLNLAMIAADRDGVLSAVRELSQVLIEGGLPRSSNLTRNYIQIEHWIGMERLLNVHVRHLPKCVSPDDFYHAMSPVDHVTTQDAGVTAQYQQFSMARLMWRLIDKNPPERRQVIAKFIPRLQDETLILELARTLEARGFYRESIPIYRQLIASDPDDFTLIRNFFTACSKARDHQPALKLLDQFFSKELPRSSGMTYLYLAQRHAHFLAMAHDSQSLIAYSKKIPAIFSASEDLAPSELANQYYRSLLTFYQQSKQSDKELATLMQLKARKALSRADHLAAAHLLIAQNQVPQAQLWLESLSFNQSPSEVDLQTIRLLSDLYCEQAKPPQDQLADLTRQALKYQQVDLILHLCKRLEQAGLTSMSDSALLLALRAAPDKSDEKNALLLTLIKNRLNRGMAVAELAPLMRRLLTSLQTNSPLCQDWFELLRAGKLSQTAAYRQALKLSEPQQHGQYPNILWKLSVHLLNDSSSLAQGMIATDISADDCLIALEQMVAAKQYPAAKQLLDDYSLSHPYPLGLQNPERLLKILNQIQDKPRITSLHARLMQEPSSELFRRYARIYAIPGFQHRQHLPQAFAQAGYPQLAESLYLVYLDALKQDGRAPAAFLIQYAQFSIQQKNYAIAEDALQQVFHHSSRADQASLVDAAKTLRTLHQQWKKNQTFASRLQRYHLSSGLRLLMDSTH
ncbi:MAG: tetratricopeptide repeat protein [Verrucomicrobiales bacterium]|nr:tetratricopeptide repeat protein [Verrucomicrobiales bacterium]